MSYSAIFALQEGTSLVIGGDVGVVEIPRGHAIIFHGNLVHAGNAYKVPNIRAFVYITIPEIYPEANAKVFITR